jgi:hypothetical protein
MLEQPALLIVRDTVWRIVEPNTGRPLGIARRRMTRAPLGIGWLARSAMDVFEVEDEPLVFSVQQLWGLSPKWEVCDADGQRIAILGRGRIVDAFGQTWSVWEQTSNEMRFHGVHRIYAVAQNSNEGVYLTFSLEVRSNPLLKMGLLAAVLVTDA